MAQYIDPQEAKWHAHHQSALNDAEMIKKDDDWKDEIFNDLAVALSGIEKPSLFFAMEVLDQIVELTHVYHETIQKPVTKLVEIAAKKFVMPVGAAGKMLLDYATHVYHVGNVDHANENMQMAKKGIGMQGRPFSHEAINYIGIVIATPRWDQKEKPLYKNNEFLGSLLSEKEDRMLIGDLAFKKIADQIEVDNLHAQKKGKGRLYEKLYSNRLKRILLKGTSDDVRVAHEGFGRIVNSHSFSLDEFGEQMEFLTFIQKRYLITSEEVTDGLKTKIEKLVIERDEEETKPHARQMLSKLIDMTAEIVVLKDPNYFLENEEVFLDAFVKPEMHPAFDLQGALLFPKEVDKVAFDKRDLFKQNLGMVLADAAVKNPDPSAACNQAMNAVLFNKALEQPILSFFESKMTLQGEEAQYAAESLIYLTRAKNGITKDAAKEILEKFPDNTEAAQFVKQMRNGNGSRKNQ